MSDPASRPSLLLVDDDEVFRNRMARAFVERGYEVSTAGDYDSAVRFTEPFQACWAVIGPEPSIPFSMPSTSKTVSGLR